MAEQVKLGTINPGRRFRWNESKGHREWPPAEVLPGPRSASGWVPCGTPGQKNHHYNPDTMVFLEPEEGEEVKNG